MIWNFIEEQILGMKWLNELIGTVLGKIGLDISGKLGGSIHFFIYDVIKITILLCMLIYVISYIQSYFPPERSKKILGRFKGISANCIAALLGTVYGAAGTMLTALSNKYGVIDTSGTFIQPCIYKEVPEKFLK